MIKKLVRHMYIKYIRDKIKREITKQRLKLILWDSYGYLILLTLKNLNIITKIKIIINFLKIDWNVEHGHKPSEISKVCYEISKRKAINNEIVLEAGCYLGGGSAKLSLICKRFNYDLHIYDSFQGVENIGEEIIGEFNFSGSYVAEFNSVVENIKLFGELKICHFHKGWFKDTFQNFKYSVKVCLIDCDLAKGTKEVLTAVLPNLSSDGIVFTQDYHIKAVYDLLHNQQTWNKLGVHPPQIRYLCNNIASLSFISNLSKYEH